MSQTRAYNPNYRPVGGLPDPDTDPQFYDGVTARRFFAWIIDVVVVWGLFVVATIMTFGIALFLLPLFAVLDFTYRTLSLSGRSATWGMRLMGIELRDGFGERFGIGQAIVHTALYTVSLMFVLSHAVSILLMLVTSRGQALHDLPMRSTAINTPVD